MVFSIPMETLVITIFILVALLWYCAFNDENEDVKCQEPFITRWYSKYPKYCKNLSQFSSLPHGK